MVAGLALIAGSAVWLAVNGATGVRHSADHHDTVPMWHRWIPAMAGLVLVRLVPPREPSATRVFAERTSHVRAGVLLASAVLFAVVLRLVGGGEPAHTVLKLTLLLAVPLVLFRLTRGEDPVVGPVSERSTAWWRYGPVAPVAAWFLLFYTGPTAAPTSDYAASVDAVSLVLTFALVFALNGLLEEVFYRRWLQTRWEGVLGRWPAIVLVSLLWAVWHVGIQGTGHLPTDLASALVNQGVTGLFLGYLWSRYRVMWPVLTVHGLMNAAPILLGAL
nr:CPBP family intramembrane glutamic endopeptidase [Nocardiopsis sinuspersici]